MLDVTEKLINNVVSFTLFRYILPEITSLLLINACPHISRPGALYFWQLASWINIYIC